MLSVLSVEARRVDVEKAEKAARSYTIGSKSKISQRKDFRLRKTVSKRIARKRPEQRAAAQQAQQQQQQQAQQQQSQQQEDEPLFYVFAANGNDGFIIISGDDVAKPVLGYSDDGTYDDNNPNLAYWLENLSQEIEYAIVNSLPQDEQIKAKWEALERDEQPAGASGDYLDPLVKTKWNQDAPYNNLCPEISGTPTYTGCVATAMAQIMKYHGHPASRTVEIPGYTSSSAGLGIGPIPVSGYDWNNMANTYSSSSTSIENQAVAELMYHCGVSVKMDYGTGASNAYSSDVVTALRSYYDYDAGLAYLFRSDYSYLNWVSMLKTELKAGRPVFYNGSGSGGGHAFVCDGYDINDLFHFNWGWGGSSDGYFEVSALNPGSIGIGGGAGGYNQGQGMIIGIRPSGSGETVTVTNLGLYSFEASKSSLSSKTESFSVTAGTLTNTGTDTVWNIYLGVLLYGEDGSYYEHETEQQDLNGLSPGYYYDPVTLLFNCSLPSDLPVGTYKLYPAFSLSGEEMPSIISGINGNRYITVLVKPDGSVTLSGDAETPNLSLISLKAVGDLYQNKIGIFEAEISNNGMSDYNSNINLIMSGSQTITEPVVIPKGTTKTIGFSETISVSPGNYLLFLWYDPNNNGSAPSKRLPHDSIYAEVKAEPVAPPSLSLASAPSFLTESNAVPQNVPNLTVQIENTGGIYQGNVTVYIFLSGENSPFSTFGSVFASIDNGETKSLQYNNPLDLTLGQEYDAYVYVNGYDYLYPKFTFTLTAPVYSGDASLKSLIVKDAGTQVPLALAPAFSSSDTVYTAIAGSGTGAVSIIGEANHHRARFDNIENATLSAGENHFNLEVTAEDGTTKLRYKIKVTSVSDTVDAETPDITGHPQSAAYTVGDTATALSVTAGVSDGGVLSYQWYRDSINSNTGGEAIAGETQANYTPPTNIPGTAYYYAVVTNTNDGVNGSTTAAATSNAAKITVNDPVNAEKPVISAHPQSATYTIGETALPLWVSAHVSDGGVLSYQWYSEGIISGATDSTYTPSTAAIGTKHYYVLVRNTNTAATGWKADTTMSLAAVITVIDTVDAETPDIIEHPQSAAYTVGETASPLWVSARVTDGGVLSYQWYSGGMEISGATDTVYTPSTVAIGTAYYHAVITNTNTGADITGSTTAAITSSMAAITVNDYVNAQAPDIYIQPQSAAYTVGETASSLWVSARVTDGGVLSYQWFSEDMAIAGATDTIYTPSTAAAGTKHYHVRVVNTNIDATGSKVDTVISDVATITVNDYVNAQKPNINAHPQSATYTVGETASPLWVSARVTDGGVLSYQWYRGGMEIVGATDTIYAPSTDAVGTEYYYVWVMNTNPAATGWKVDTIMSYLAIITVNNLVNAQIPAIALHPQSAAYTVGETASPLSVTASVADGGTLSYQWYSNIIESNAGGNTIFGATLATYTPPTAAAGTGYYYAVITNTNTGENITGLQTAAITSNVATIRVNDSVDAQEPIIYIHPQSAAYIVGETAAALSVTAGVTDGGTLSYQWYSNIINSNIGGKTIFSATMATYTPPIDTVGTLYYYAVVTNTNAGLTGSQTSTVTSDVAAITVKAIVDAQTPAITAHPQSATYAVSETAMALSVTASVADGGTLSYQWYSNIINSTVGGAAIGASLASYTPPTDAQGTTYYYAVVTNTNAGADITGSQTATATSLVAEITVNNLVNAQAPGISEQPQSADYDFNGTAAALSVTASVADGVLSYQWYSNTIESNAGGDTIFGATLATYTPPTDNAGTLYYYVRVTNTNTDASITGSQTAARTSNVAKITVADPVNAETPDITLHPQSAAYTVNETATPLSVTAHVSDGGILSYQWYRGGMEIAGASLASYTPSTSAVGTEYYHVRVTNTNTDASITGLQADTVISDVATITVNDYVDAQTPNITAQPQSAAYTVNETATLSVTASVADGGALSYQWYSNTISNNTGGEAIEGASLATYTLPTDMLGTIYYYAVITNTNTGAGITGSTTATIASEVAAITVNNPVDAQAPAITAQPQSATYTVNETAMALSVTASVADGGTLSYQWYRNSINSNIGGSLIDNATMATYTPPTDTVMTLYYYVSVTNINIGAGVTGSQISSTISSAAKITVERAKSTDASLSSLTVSGEILSPAFHADTEVYTVNVSNGVTLVDIIGAANHPAATVIGNVTGKTVNIGIDTVNIIVTAEDGISSRTYRLILVRTVSSDAALSGITLSSGTLSPAFDADTTSYTVNVASDVSLIDVSGAASHANAAVTGNVSDMPLEVGDNIVNITVLAEDGTSSRTYTVTIHRSSSDATLSSLTVSTEYLSFEANTAGDTINIPGFISLVDVIGTASHAGATVSGNVEDMILDVGDNIVNITVTAEDGTSATYTLTIHRLSSDATLKSLTVSSGTLSFHADTTSYTVNVASSVTGIDVIGTANHTGASVIGNVIGKTLDVGDNIVNITVRAEDDTTSMLYTVTIHRLSNDAALSSLTVSTEDLSFEANTTGDTINVPNFVSLVDVIGTASHAGATVIGNVEDMILDVGDNIVNITVTAEDGTSMNYTLTIRRLSNDATLKSLKVNSGTLSPPFDAYTTSYTVNVANSVTGIDVSGTANHVNATVGGNVIGKTLDVGDNIVNITVTAEDDTTSMLYTVTIHRLSSDATLSSLTLSSGSLSFHADTTDYTVSVANSVTLIDVIGAANHAGASVIGNVSDKTLEVGDNIVDITVIAEDSTSMTYTVTIHRLSNDATLNNLTVSSGTLPFDANTTGYMVSIANDVTLIDVIGTASHPAAMVSGNVSGKALDVGNNTVSITVVAEDGTVRTYTVTLVRAASSDAALSDLTVSDGTLSPAFDADTTSYTVNVANRVSLINVTGVASHANATVSGNVIDMPLEVGANVVDITVTAENGSTNTYTVTIIRAEETETDLVAITVNGDDVSIDDDNTIEYAAPCGETSFTLDLQAPPDAVVTVNGLEYTDGQNIELTDDLAVANIWIATETGKEDSHYTLNINAPIDDSRLYYRRWDDVLAINRNPATNGGYDVSEIHWYRRQDGSPAGEGYITVQPGTEQDYYVEIRTDERLRKVCGASEEARGTEKVIAYPNPVPRGESLQLKTPETFVGGTLNIYDIKGSLKKSGLPLPATVNSVNVSDLDSGIYLLHVIGKDGKRNEMKLIIE
jgi:hypothetical protein